MKRQAGVTHAKCGAVSITRDGTRGAALSFAVAAPQEPFATYSAAVQIFDEGAGGCRLAWTVDFLPNELSENIASQMDAALRVMKPTLERS